MEGIACPFRHKNHPEESADVSRINRRWLREANFCGDNQGGRLEPWTDCDLQVSVYECSLCDNEEIPADVRAFGYSLKFDTYVCLFTDGSWRHISARIVEADTISQPFE